MNTKSNITASIVKAIDAVNVLSEQIPNGPISIVDVPMSMNLTTKSNVITKERMHSDAEAINIATYLAHNVAMLINNDGNQLQWIHQTAGITDFVNKHRDGNNRLKSGVNSLSNDLNALVGDSNILRRVEH